MKVLDQIKAADIPLELDREKFDKLLEESANLVIEDLYHFSALRRMGEVVGAGRSFQEVCADLANILLEELHLFRVALILEANENELEIVASACRWEETEQEGRGWRPKHRIALNGDDDSPIARAWKASGSWVENLPPIGGVENPMNFVGIHFSCLGKHGILCMAGSQNRSIESRDYALWSLLSNQISLVLEAVLLIEQERRWSNLLEEKVQERTKDLEAAHEELVRTRDQLIRAEKLKALGQMASGIAHDFNNILATILGYSQLYLPRVEDTDLRRCLQVIEQSAWDGASTVQRIQEFAGVHRAGRTMEPVSINLILEEVREMTRPRWRDQAQKEGRTVHFQLNLSQIPMVRGNPSELREVMTNLIFNSLDAMPAGGEIQISTSSNASKVEIEIRDTGVGIPQPDLQRIFDPFFTTKGMSHSGLGLSTTYGIIQRHGGEIHADSEPGRGTTIRISLPSHSEKMLESDEAKAFQPGLEDLRESRILVIEDEDPLRQVLVKILKTKGHEVHAVASGREGMAVFAPGLFDLVITDLGMPEMSGWDVAEALRKVDPKIPVVLMTGWGMEIPADELRRRGISQIITKPFQADMVLLTVAKILAENPPSPQICEPAGASSGMGLSTA